MVNYYSILGLTRNATQDEIKSAYRTLCLKYHPDRCKLQNATQMFQAIEEAYEVLSDDEKKRLFDASLDNETSENCQQQYSNNADDDEEFQEFVKRSNRANAQNRAAYGMAYVLSLIVIWGIIIGIIVLLGWLFIKYVWPWILKAIVWGLLFCMMYGFGKMFEKK